MVQRAKEKAKRPAARSKAAAPADGAVPADQRVKALEQERDHLKAELEAAHTRIAALEESRTAVANRIDWVIERLSSSVDRGD